MEESKIDELVKDILLKRELSTLDDTFVKEKTLLFLQYNKKVKEKLKKEEYAKFRRSKEHKEAVKAIRSELREIYGAFILKRYDKKEEFLEKLATNPCLENHNHILALHKSSNERLNYYPVLYKKIFDITGFPKTIFDLACGFNPFSYPYLGCKPKYCASDISESDMKFIKSYFDIMNIEGEVQTKNLIVEDISELSKKADVVFLFKALDSLETVKRNISRKLIESIKSKFIVVSFATQSLGGKKMIKKERRSWFEKAAKRLEYEFEIFEMPNEVFYVLWKKYKNNKIQ